MNNPNLQIPIMCAPMQGITTAAWRSAHARIFGGVQCYYTPFMRVERGKILSRDLRDANPDNNQGVGLVPQILGCSPDEALQMAQALTAMGYSTIDVNLGCPFPPIALHHKGSGLLQDTGRLRLLVDALRGMQGVKWQVKMRLGWDDATAWRTALPIIEELEPALVTVHPRIGKQQYKGELLAGEMEQLLQSASVPVAWSGDVMSPADASALAQRHPTLAAIMVGRGLAADPAMLSPEKQTVDNYRDFANEIYQSLCSAPNGGEHQVLRRMQGFWESFLPNAPGRARKAIKKASSLDKYETAVENLFAEMQQ